jgi:predicted TIM-barrel fold metal-dependent hydrolase
LAALARRHPQARLIMGHMGYADFWYDGPVAAAMAENKRLPNLWLQPAGSPPITIRMALQGAGPDRLLFGTDGGSISIAVMRYVIAEYHSAVGQAVTNQAMTFNPERLMAYRANKR